MSKTKGRMARSCHIMAPIGYFGVESRMALDGEHAGSCKVGARSCRKYAKTCEVEIALSRMVWIGCIPILREIEGNGDSEVDANADSEKNGYPSRRHRFRPQLFE